MAKLTSAAAAEAMGEQILAPGVHGWLFDEPDAIYIPVITADNPGSGDVARFLDSLPRHRTVKFPTVLSSKLRAMLLRRGFIDREEFAPEFECICEVMVRNAEVPNAHH